MLKKNTIFDYLTQVCVIWGVSTLSCCLFCFLFGESAKGLSTIFELGNAGLSVATLLEFLGLAIIITGLRWIFFTDVLIKEMSILWRTILMLVTVILAVIVFSYLFGWFPMNQLLPWVMFLICFFVCAFISVIVSVLKEKNDKKMQDALERLRGEEL